MVIKIYGYQKKALIVAITFYIDVFRNEWLYVETVKTLEALLKKLEGDLKWKTMKKLRKLKEVF